MATGPFDDIPTAAELRDRSRQRIEQLEAQNVALLAERDHLATRVAALEAALRTIAELADDELRRLGAVPGSNVAQIEADALAALAGEPGAAAGDP